MGYGIVLASGLILGFIQNFKLHAGTITSRFVYYTHPIAVTQLFLLTDKFH